MYLDAANELGRLIASRGYALVYGGAMVGAMGAVADGALEAGGRDRIVSGLHSSSITSAALLLAAAALAWIGVESGTAKG